VAYADFVTAMMAFFMVMWLVSQRQDVKAAIGGYFRDPGAFDTFAGQGILMGGTAGIQENGAASVSNPAEMLAEQERARLSAAADRIRDVLERSSEHLRSRCAHARRAGGERSDDLPAHELVGLEAVRCGDDAVLRDERSRAEPTLPEIVTHEDVDDLGMRSVRVRVRFTLDGRAVRLLRGRRRRRLLARDPLSRAVLARRGLGRHRLDRAASKRSNHEDRNAGEEGTHRRMPELQQCSGRPTAGRIS